MRETTTAPPLTWSRAFSANPAQVGEARLFLAAILDGRPAADEAVLCLSELAANAAIHSRSRRHGGHFAVRAALHGDRLRVEVRDQGGPWTGASGGDDPHGRGLVIVSHLASAWGAESLCGPCNADWDQADRYHALARALGAIGDRPRPPGRPGD